MNKRNERVRRTGLQPKRYTQILVRGLGIRKATQDEDWKATATLPDLFNQLRSVHARHEVICDDQANPMGCFRAGEKIEGCLSTGYTDDTPSRLL
jgi:hypothetical protein